MIVKEDFLNKLRHHFSLNLYEVKIWTALLSRNVSTAGELSDIADVPRSRSYDILESLEKKGFVIVKLGKPIKYMAVSPKDVVDRYKKKLKEDSDKKVQKVESLKKSPLLKELELLHKQGIQLVEPGEFSGAIRGRHNIYNHFETMIKNAEKSVNIITTSQGIIRKLDSLKPTLEKKAKKGVDIKIAFPLTKENKALAKEIKKSFSVKDSSNIKARFCIVDGKEITFMLMNDDEVHPSYDTAVWVSTPLFATAVQNMFNSVWQNMKPIR